MHFKSMSQMRLAPVQLSASGGGTTGSVACRVISHDPYVNESFPFPSYVAGTKVIILITNLQDGVMYLFSECVWHL